MKKWERSYKDKMLYGVLGGLAESLGVSSLVVRLLFFVFFFVGGGFLPSLLYLFLGFMLPEREIIFKEDTEKPSNE